jgi:DNA-binding HxlR family transcriptional regulator
MRGRRTYGDSCGIARALDVVGERWALLIARELVLGPKRFTDLRTALPRLGPDMLAQRLRDLEAAGVLVRRRLAPPAGAQVYELTGWGRELEPVLVALGRWGSRRPLGEDPAPLSPDAAAIALETTFDPGAAAGVRASYGLRLGEHVFAITVEDRKLTVRRGAPPHADATIITDTPTLAGVLWGGRPLADAVAGGELTIEGDRGAADRMPALFAAPAPV